MQILVPADQVAERAGLQQHLECLKRSPLIDLSETLAQLDPPERELVASSQHLAGRLVHLEAVVQKLSVQLGQGGGRGSDLALKIGNLGRHGVHLTGQVSALPLQPGLLVSDLVEPLLTFLDAIPNVLSALLQGGSPTRRANGHFGFERCC